MVKFHTIRVKKFTLKDVDSFFTLLGWNCNVLKLECRSVNSERVFFNPKHYFTNVIILSLYVDVETQISSQKRIKKDEYRRRTTNDQSRQLAIYKIHSICITRCNNKVFNYYFSLDSILVYLLLVSVSYVQSWIYMYFFFFFFKWNK